MFKVRALENGYYNSVMQKEGSVFNVMARSGIVWTDKYRRTKKEVVHTAKAQLGSWMEVIEELPDLADAPKIVYVEKEEVSKDKPKTKKSTKKTKKVESKTEDKAEESDNSEQVI